MTGISTTAPESATTLSTKEKWDAAFAAWQTAKSKYDAAAAAHDADYDAAKAEGRPFNADLAAECDKSGAAEGEARFALIETLAPDFPALSVKLGLLFGPENFGANNDSGPVWSRELTDAVIADMARLQWEYAEAWLAAWTKDGGSVVIDDDGKAQIGWPVYDLSPSYRAPDPTWPDAVRDHAFICGQAAYDAIMKARYEALKTVPGGVDMLKAHMRAEGVRVIVPVTEQGK